VNDGTRWELVHSPSDLAAHWQNRENKKAKEEFDLAVNLFVYANGKTDPKNRLAAVP
jgi:hypothetical protein